MIEIIFSLFIFLLVIGLVLVIVAYAVDFPILALLGFSVLFFLSTVIVYNGNVEIPVGENAVSSYYNLTDSESNITTTYLNESTSQVYRNWPDPDTESSQRSLFGIIFAVFWFVGFALTVAFEFGSNKGGSY